MRISDELIQGFALGEPMLRAVDEEVIRAVTLAEDEAIMGPEASIKARFRELLEQCPELTRPQAYMQAVMEMGDQVIAEAVERMKVEDKTISTRFAFTRDDTMIGPLVVRVIWESKIGGEKELLITFPSNTSYEDYERMKGEIRAIIQQAARIGVQKTLAFIQGDRHPPSGIVKQPEAGVKARCLELLEQHPKLTQYQAYLLAMMEKVGYRGYLVPPELAPGVLVQLENNDRQAPLD